MVLKQFSLPSTKKKNALLPAYKQLLHLLTFTNQLYTQLHTYTIHRHATYGKLFDMATPFPNFE